MIEAIKGFINQVSDPRILFPLAVVLFFVSLRIKKIWTRRGGIIIFTALALLIALSLLNENFRVNATAPDNLPILGLLFLVPFFMWFSLKEALENDARIAAGRPPKEREVPEKVLVWPDLVYAEFISTVVLGVFLIIWSVLVPAPLEEPANPTFSPPVMKAPWYFVGLQEMLVYFDPWIAGVVLPTLIIIGLMAIPYIDRNPRGAGYFTFEERKWEITVFLFGFVVLWVLLILIGTFLRGPNWNFFGPYEFWDVNKVVPMVNVNLSEYIWVRLLGTALPDNILLREIFGILLILAYYTVIPPLAAVKLRPFNRFYNNLGPLRYHLMMFLLLSMLSLPIKMFLRWTINLKYIVAIPEYFFNI